MRNFDCHPHARQPAAQLSTRTSRGRVYGERGEEGGERERERESAPIYILSVALRASGESNSDVSTRSSMQCRCDNEPRGSCYEEG